MKPTTVVERSRAQFQSSSVTYNDSSVTYNSASTLYGGSDRNQSLGPVPKIVIESKPNLTEVN